jgi:hypothetical protein
VDRSTALAVAAALDLRIPPLAPCPLCLLSVAWALRDQDERAVRRRIRFHAPILWDEGLEGPTLGALERARGAGVPDAEEALANVRARGARSVVVQALVRVRAQEMLEDMRRNDMAAMN